MIAKVIENYWHFYEQAKNSVAKQPDGSVSESQVIEKLQWLIPFDEKAERNRRAKAVINALTRNSEDKNSGQLCFEGFGSWDWQPHRLIRSDNGGLIENANATLEFKIADAQRSTRNARVTQLSADRKTHEAHVFSQWTVTRIQAGDAKETLTWERCVKDLGLYDPLAPRDPDSEDIEPDDELD